MSYASYIAKNWIYHRFVGWFLRDFFQKVENHSMFDREFLSSQETHRNGLKLFKKALSWEFQKVQNCFCRESVSRAICYQSRAMFRKSCNRHTEHNFILTRTLVTLWKKLLKVSLLFLLVTRRTTTIASPKKSTNIGLIRVHTLCKWFVKT